MDTTKDKEGNLIKKRYRLTCDILKDNVTMLFRLEPSNSILNI